MLLFRWSRCAASGVLFLLMVGAVFGQEAAVVGGLPEDLIPALKPILAEAMLRSPTTINRGITLARAEAQTYVSRGAMLPNIGGDVRYAFTQASNATTGSNSNNSNTNSALYYEANLNQPLYQWGVLKAQADIDKIGVKITAREYAEAYRLLALQIRARFLELIVRKAALQAAQSQFKLVTRGLERTKENLKDGRATSGDVAGIEMAVEDGQLGLERSAADFANLKRQFLRLTGLAQLPDSAIPDDLPKPVPDLTKGGALLAAFERGGAKDTLQSQIYVLKIKQSELNYQIQSKRLYPKFTSSLGLNQTNSSQVDSSGLVQQELIANRFVGITANWTVFDGLATKGEKLKALAEKRANERALQTQIEETTDDVHRMWEQVGFSARALSLAETRYGQAQGGYSMTERNLAEGRASKDDLDQASVGLLGAKPSVLLARIDYLNRWSDFVSLTNADPALNNLPPRYVR